MDRGEVRLTSGSNPADYTFTGQYSNVSDFGLLFYNARWYDPALGRMAQADSVVPDGVQGLDRYAHVNNNPMNFTDPTGHFGKHNDDRSDYWNKQNQNKVKDLEEKWEREKEERAAQEMTRELSMLTKLEGGATLYGLLGGTGMGGGDGVPGTFLSDLAYGLDNLAAVTSYVNMLLTDVTMALIVGGGCATGAGCVPAVGWALQMDFAMTSTGPFGAAENTFSSLASLFTTLNDVFVHRTTYISLNSQHIQVGIGLDTVVSVGNTLAGTVPEANWDAWINNNQLRYDALRRSGAVPATSAAALGIDLVWP